MIRESSVVVINDDPTQLRLTERILDGAGYPVAAFLDPVEALDQLRRASGARLVVVDLHMPRIDGWKVCDLLRSPEFRGFAETPILLVSATFSGSDVEAITSSAGADAFLAAPFDADDLLNLVRDLVERRAPKRVSRVLLVEDDSGTSALLAAVFIRHGYEVLSAATLAQAEAFWRERSPDVVILDYHLPDGTCEELLARVHRIDGRAVILVMTGDPDPTLPIRLLELGADRYVRKPFDPALLVALAAQAGRERSLLRVEAVLELRTRQWRSSEARYESLFDAIPDMVLLLDERGRILDANRAAEAQLKVSRPRLLGVSVQEVLDQIDEGAGGGPLVENMNPMGCRSFHAVAKVSGGDPFPVDVVSAFYDSWEEGCLVLLARDARPRVRAQEERSRLDKEQHQVQRLESLGMLAGSVAHDFNNLLVGILGNASLGLVETLEDDPVRECLVNIQVAARKASDLANQILTFAGRGTHTVEPIDLTKLVSEMGMLLSGAVSPTATVTYRLDARLPAIQGDRSELSQVVMNLIINASDALAGRPGTIDVETMTVGLTAHGVGRSFFGAPPKVGDYVVLSCRDSGCGIKPEVLSHIFDPFFTTKPHGRGFGLSTTLGVVRGHGGFLMLDSRVGVGTVVKIYLPAAS